MLSSWRLKSHNQFSHRYLASERDLVFGGLLAQSIVPWMNDVIASLSYDRRPSGSETPGDNGRLMNAMTVDVEDYFQVSAFESRVARDQWDSYESRVCGNTERLLDMFAAAGVTATFFVLGWVAEKYPALVRRIADAGHEIGSHGYAHRLVYDMTPLAFAEDVRHAKNAIESVCGHAVLGYRAPSYSITRASLWALDVLLAEGHVYDASVFPIHHDRYGIPDAPRHAHQIPRERGTIWELPGSTIRWGRVNLPIGGGGYFRLLPYDWTKRAIAHINLREGRPVMFYLHPWEIDPEQPRLNASLLSRFRHYQNLSKTEPRLRRLLSDFQFGPARSMLSSAPEAGALTPPALH
jgi:polysaccharide deacetylase family protein (PEP-CTERM system associated)